MDDILDDKKCIRYDQNKDILFYDMLDIPRVWRVGK